MDTREEILQILKERGEILQKDLWKELKIDSSKCSRILRKLEKEGLIKRIEVVVDGVKTFKILLAEAEIKKKDKKDILSQDDLSGTYTKEINNKNHSSNS